MTGVSRVCFNPTRKHAVQIFKSGMKVTPESHTTLGPTENGTNAGANFP
jgi:hypothetical protein